MYTGKLTTITFKFGGDSVEAILDRLPTAKKLKMDGKASIIQAEVHWEGVKRWLLSQGDCIEVLRPQKYREEMIGMLENMRRSYK